MKKFLIIFLFLFNFVFANNCIIYNKKNLICSYIYFNGDKVYKNIVSFKIKNIKNNNIYLIKKIQLDKILTKYQEKKYFVNYLKKNKIKLTKRLKNLLCCLFKKYKNLHLNNIYIRLNYDIINLNIKLSKKYCKK